MKRQKSERELQLFVIPITAPHGAAPRLPVSHSDHLQLDLSLSMSIGPSADQRKSAEVGVAGGDVQALKLQTSEQSRLASAERAYAQHVMELARRELELAEREFARARAIWERARGEVEKVERIKEMPAVRRIGSAALQITCHACMRGFHP